MKKKRTRGVTLEHRDSRNRELSTEGWRGKGVYQLYLPTRRVFKALRTVVTVERERERERVYVCVFQTQDDSVNTEQGNAQPTGSRDHAKYRKKTRKNYSGMSQMNECPSLSP